MATQLTQTQGLLKNIPGAVKAVFVDLGYRAIEALNSSVQIIRRGKHKSLTHIQRR